MTRADGRFSILGMRVGGPYSVSVNFVGTGAAFEPKTVTNLTVSLGTSTDVNVEVRPIAVQETVTVTGDAPLLDTASSTIASNIDPRQMQELPVNGRNWMDLTMLSAGSRSNASMVASVWPMALPWRALLAD